MLIGNGAVGLVEPIPTASQPDSAAPGLASISGLHGWWDAATLASLVTPSGGPAANWSDPVASISNGAGDSGTLLPYSYAASGSHPIAVPRLSGLLGGIGKLASFDGSTGPVLDPDLGFAISDSVISNAGGWTAMLVWSRSNWRNGSANDSGPVTLISSGGSPVLQADGLAGQGRLVLCPGANQTILSNSLERRHTHSVVLRSGQNADIDVWLDGTLAASAAPNAIPGGIGTTTLLLHDGGPLGAAQCYFHEAAEWVRALSDTEIDSTLAYLTRWYRGERRGIKLLIDGQSNAINYALNDGAALLLAQGVAWHLGALAYSVLATTGAPSSYTMESGHGIYAALNGSYPGSFVEDPGDESDPSTWQLGADGLAVQQAIGSIAQDELADICAIVWPWNETDSLRPYADKSTFLTAAKRFLQLERAMLGTRSTTVPLIWWNAIPYGTDAGMQMHRSAVSTLSADPSQAIAIGNHQTTDSNARGSSWDPATGIASGGDSAHRDTADNQRFARLAAVMASRAVLASGISDSLQAIPAGLPTAGGPQIVHAYLQQPDTIVLTIRHDAGTDLLVPRQASSGKGFAVMDGGTPDAPGPIISPASCSRTDSTHLVLQLSAALQHTAADCSLYYPYGANAIGRGNAVTDNYSTLPKPAGWDIALDLGSEWDTDFPLAATFAGISLSDTAL